MTMASLYDLARMTTATTGTGTITLGSAVSGYLSFAAAGVPNGALVSYGILDGANCEVGLGTYTTSGTTLTRGPIVSNNSNAAINLSGTAQVIICALANDFAGLPSIEAFGGIGDGSTDNTTAFTKAIAAAVHANQIGVRFGPGVFYFGSNLSVSLSTGQSLSLFGAGKDTTQLSFASGKGVTVSFADFTNSVHVRDMSYLTGGTNSADGVHIDWGGSAYGNSSLAAASDFSHVCFRGADGYGVTDYWANAINCISVSNFTFDDVSIYGSSSIAGTGISTSGTSANVPVQFNIKSCTFQNLNIGYYMGGYTQGVAISAGCNFTACNYGVTTTSASSTGLDQLAVSTSQFNCVVCCIYGQANVVNTLIANNALATNTNNGQCIALADAGLFAIIGNNIGASPDTLTDTYGIICTSGGSVGGVIASNIIAGFTVYGVWLESGTSNIKGANVYASNGTNVKDDGSSNAVT
jgi:hypothetical protein